MRAAILDAGAAWSGRVTVRHVADATELDGPEVLAALHAAVEKGLLLARCEIRCAGCDRTLGPTHASKEAAVAAFEAEDLPPLCRHCDRYLDRIEDLQLVPEFWLAGRAPT